MEYPGPLKLTNDVWMVPCKITPDKRTFQPISKPLDHLQKNYFKKFRNTWSATEDKLLKGLVQINKARNWEGVAKEINTKLYDSFHNRTGKQCRERWLNQLNPLIKKSNFTKEEDDFLLTMQKNLGNKWRQISEYFTGRTENQLKNRWKLIKRAKKIKRSQLENTEPTIKPECGVDEIGYFLFSETGSPCPLEDIDTGDLIDVYSNKVLSEEINKKILLIEDIFPSFENEFIFNSRLEEESGKDEGWKDLILDIKNEERLWEKIYNLHH